MAKDQTIPLGFEIGTGLPVRIPLRHMAVTGQTQQSGKTTTLEALIDRSEGTALTFLTKRGEGAFAGGRRVQPYFRDRADWQFVTALIDATLQEKNKFLRQWIIRTCRTTKTLAEVQDLVRDKLAKARGFEAGAYTELDAYLELIVPEIKKAHLAKTLDLRPGLNVMDVIGFTTPMQMLFIQSALDWVNDHCEKTTVVIPEAWEFIPQSKASPVKKSAETLIRKGAGLGNHIWLDSQDMAGVDNLALRACTVWLIGVQREANEIKRALDNIPANLKRPKAGDVATLERGQFFACFGKSVVKVYVQPAWMTAVQARAIALGTADLDDVGNQAPKPPAPQEDEVDPATARALTEENERLKAEAAEAEQRGFEKGMTAGLRQAGEFWAVAALDVRDNAQRLVHIGEHLGVLAREGTWSLPRGRANPASRDGETRQHESDLPKPAAQLKRIADSGGTETVDAAQPPNMGLIDVLVRSHPRPLPAELWGEFAGKSARSGWWHGQMKILREDGLVQNENGRFAPTQKAIAASKVKPARPVDDVALWALWRDVIRGKVGSGAIGLLGILYAHRPHALSAEQWGLLAEKSPRSGWWNGALKPLREWELLASENGRFEATEKGAAVLGDLAQSEVDTAEALRRARRAVMPASSQNLYDLLVAGDSKQKLAERAGWSMRSGHWNGAIKGLMESGLVEERGGILDHAREKL
jgi:hypothetical protein